MTKTLADKMEVITEWGALVIAESIRLTMEHVSPSLLVHKTYGDSYRMVNDFSP